MAPSGRLHSIGGRLLNLVADISLPPASLAVLALVLLFCGRTGRVVAGFVLVALIALGMPIVATGLLNSLAPPASADAGLPPSAIVILSGDAIRVEDPNALEPGPITLDRTRAGAALARRTGLPILVSGGELPEFHMTLAAMMTQSLHDDFRLDTRWQENRSRDTWENAELSAAILREAGINRILSRYARLAHAPISSRLSSLRARPGPCFSPPPFHATFVMAPLRPRPGCLVQQLHCSPRVGRPSLLYVPAMKNRLTMRVERTVDALGPEWDDLFRAGAGLQSSRPWFEATAAAAIPDGAEPRFLAVSDEAGPLALLPMLAGPDKAWGSLTTPYTCLYQPLLRPGSITSTEPIADIGRYCGRWPITRFEALDPDWPGLGLLRRSLAAAGLVSRTFSHFGNWHEPITANSWDTYLAARPGALRETIRRRTRAAERAGTRIELHSAPSALPEALDAYEAVYRRSWKSPEPFPAFNGALIRALAASGRLRIGLMWSGDTPIAAQYWSVVADTATVLKLAHDEHYKPLSPGTVLTAATIRRLIEVDGVKELDFGRGDDGYKQGWASKRRLRIGLLAINVRTTAGLRELIGHDAGTLRRNGLKAYAVARKLFGGRRHSETSC